MTGALVDGGSQSSSAGAGASGEPMTDVQVEGGAQGSGAGTSAVQEQPAAATQAMTYAQVDGCT